MIIAPLNSAHSKESGTNSTSSPLIGEEVAIEYLRRIRDKYPRLDLLKLPEQKHVDKRIDILRVPEGLILFFGPEATVKELGNFGKDIKLKEEMKKYINSSIVAAMIRKGNVISKERKGEEKEIIQVLNKIAPKHQKSLQVYYLLKGVERKRKRMFTDDERSLIKREVEAFFKHFLPELNWKDKLLLASRINVYLESCSPSHIKINKEGNPDIYLFMNQSETEICGDFFREIWHCLRKMGVISTIYLSTTAAILRKIELEGLRTLHRQEKIWFDAGRAVSARMAEVEIGDYCFLPQIFLHNSLRDWFKLFHIGGEQSWHRRYGTVLTGIIYKKCCRGDKPSYTKAYELVKSVSQAKGDRVKKIYRRLDDQVIIESAGKRTTDKALITVSDMGFSSIKMRIELSRNIEILEDGNPPANSKIRRLTFNIHKKQGQPGKVITLCNFNGGKKAHINVLSISQDKKECIMRIQFSEGLRLILTESLPLKTNTGKQVDLIHAFKIKSITDDSLISRGRVKEKPIFAKKGFYPGDIAVIPWFRWKYLIVKSGLLKGKLQ